ncbi:MAG: hypothetical protein PHT31_00015 [Candidatus Omnitrophica bacterium]|nr:hypothetical protein [Candidatus Omnitrophota bacterium]MDD5652532.1 hypothetical protein [Candidatus Omnitrophota bacterium]
MVEKDNSIHLFIGTDSLSKDTQLNKIKESLLIKQTADFNLDTLYGRELALKDFQEKILLLPVKAKKRILLVRQAQALKSEIKDFILKELKSLQKRIVLVLDFDHQEPKDDFVRKLKNFAQISYFGSVKLPDTFGLNRHIESGQLDAALRVLNELLTHGEKAERIMGGLRYAWERDIRRPLELKRKLKLLLNCDLEIKRGKLKAELALEKLVIALCSLKIALFGLRKPQGKA